MRRIHIYIEGQIFFKSQRGEEAVRERINNNWHYQTKPKRDPSLHEKRESQTTVFHERNLGMRRNKLCCFRTLLRRTKYQ